MSQLPRQQSRTSKDRCFIIGNGPSIKLMNLDALKDEITIGCNVISYSGFEPTYICISDTTKFDKYPAKDIYASKTSTYILNKDINPRRFLHPSRYHQVQFLPTGLLDTQVQQLDPSFRTTHRSTWVMTDLCIPLAYHLGIKEIYLIGIDHKNVKS